MTPAESPVAPRRATFAAASVPTAARMTIDAREERRFLREAAAQSRFELDASKLAFSKSANGAVRSLAASLINHNNTIGLELAHLLHTRGMALPMIGNEQRTALNRLTKLNGSRFDAAYMQQVGLHEAVVARDYEKASLAIHEPQINAWVLKTLPTARYHLTLAQRAVPADPQLAKWNRAGPKPGPGKTATAHLPQRSLISRPLLPTGAMGVQPVAATGDSRFSASNTP